MKIIYCLSFAEFLEVNIQHSIRARILFPYTAYMLDDLRQIIRDYFPSFGKGCRIIRRDEFLEEVWYEPSKSPVMNIIILTFWHRSIEESFLYTKICFVASRTLYLPSYGSKKSAV